MRRVVIVGNSGSGKTTLARELAATLQVRHIELDGLFHQANWIPQERPSFVAAVQASLDAADAAAGGWVVCGNYRWARTTVWPRADSIVWLDLPRSVVMPRVIGRSVRRVVTRRELWNGNRESWRNLLALHDPARSIVAWSWTRAPVYHRRYAELMGDPLWAELRWHRLGTPAEVAGFALRASAPTS